ncbi:IPIL1 protein, partial [Bucco capensis]|nr:IPIL1 protein [Bucco capensis]
VKELMDDVIRFLQVRLSKGYWPELQQPIGVGAAFEGWSPNEDEPVYHLLVPLKPPRSYVFKLGLDSTGQIPAQESYIQVELECTCSKEEAGRECFVQHLTEELRRPPGLSDIVSLCTSSNLDVQKTASWFRGLLSLGWAAMPQSRQYGLKLLPSARSCMLQLTSVKGKTRGETFLVEIIFGVQKDNSDIFLSSEARDSVLSPSTMWRVSYAVAEGKTFKAIAARVPRGSFHLKCLQACTSILVGTSFSTHIMKTIVMHLLTTIPLSHWQDRDFVPRLQDIMWYLSSSLKEKRLNHFFIGNKNLPEEINLPAPFQSAKPCNLFHHLAQDPAAHGQALKEFEELLDR